MEKIYIGKPGNTFQKLGKLSNIDLKFRKRNRNGFYRTKSSGINMIRMVDLTFIS